MPEDTKGELLPTIIKNVDVRHVVGYLANLRLFADAADMPDESRDSGCLVVPEEEQ